MRILLLGFIAACGGGATDPDSVVDAPGGGSDGGMYPLAVGRTWSYDVVSTYSSCPAGRHDMQVLETGTTEGRSTFKVKGFCGPTGHTSIAGNVVEEYYDWGATGWLRTLDAPVADGHSWTTTNGSATFAMTYSNAGSVAGYSDCWRVTQGVQYTSYWIYCRGVGLVKYEMVDAAGGTIRADLQSKNF